MRGTFAIVLSCGLGAWIALGGAGCAGRSASPDLKDAAQVVAYLSAPFNLTRSVFPVVFPEGRPSDYVSFFFSPAGRAEWPIPIDESEAEAFRMARVPILPPTVNLVSRQVNPEGGMQLVVDFDDEQGLVLVRGYVDPAEPPVLKRKWPLRQVQPSRIAVEMVRAQELRPEDCRSF